MLGLGGKRNSTVTDHGWKHEAYEMTLHCQLTQSKLESICLSCTGVSGSLNIFDRKTTLALRKSSSFSSPAHRLSVALVQFERLHSPRHPGQGIPTDILSPIFLQTSRESRRRFQHSKEGSLQQGVLSFHSGEARFNTVIFMNGRVM